jgi:hypothetical protein
MTQLTITELFTPATNSQWLQTLLTNAATLQLTTTSWQSGGMALTILQLVSNTLSQEDGIISIMAQGGFLDFAASGQVTYVAANGTTVTAFVTPDPSVPAQNPNGTPGWLDVLANSVYNLTRIGSQQAANQLAIANASANTYGPYVGGSYHVANPLTAATYSNEGSLTINPGVFAGTSVTGATNTLPITVTTQTPHGLSTGNIVLISGVGGNTVANAFWQITKVNSTQFTLNNSSGNGAYTSGGTVLVAQTAEFQADASGPSGSSGVGQITQAVTSNTGVSVYNTLAFFGANWESNTALAARCRAAIQAISPGGPRGAYQYFALSAYQLLLAETPPVVLTAPITKVLVQSSAVTGVVTVTIANANGAVPGVANLGISGASNATPIKITTVNAHTLSTGAFVEISGVLGNTNANGQWQVTVTSATQLTLNGSVGNGSYSGGGILEGSDLGEVDFILNSNVVPDAVTEFTQSATNFDVAIAANVTVPQNQITSYLSNAQTLFATYFASLPIGGINGMVQYYDIIGILYAAGAVSGAASYVVSINSVTINGAQANLTYPGASYVAVLSPAPAITAVGS